ncbi:GNAT family N-acetyltransferase [Leptospira gomenensis]|uniref:GNAT family N-acetyltransferase n=1 Tax=Leptospira gomenensis TaxID=2484974 RepID=A0A5F1YTW6_9LEPT|nr:arsenic resistance N-acetyltransferase ArsN2 [Leptospira gomenensis]TGK31665.1 GNAT family N-acetyltransferase [Leptospira gomenensis]TGK41765.1 GNAT family N-acetyltransferase [Leptospira gomenensis]TGK43340.1 GNAT family N-acetyltransferase [Leptospira gomenensis]TGK61334.1 GNAT family N-acetyltransferase [Leptospira gomenensis]
MKKTIYRFETEEDEPFIQSLLEKNNLPYQDIGIGNRFDFILAERDGTLVGVVGLEVFDEVALLRSFCVEEKYRNEKIGTSLYQKMLAHARSKGVDELYLLTTSAERYFLRLGFEIVDRKTAPDSIRTSSEFQDFCPGSAAFMKRSLPPSP